MKGIYSITNKINGFVYIGSSMDCQHRWHWHITDLKANMHSNYYLQQDWNKYDEFDFSFDMVESLPFVTDRSFLLEREQAHLDMHPFKKTYNIVKKIFNKNRRNNPKSQKTKRIKNRSKFGCINRISIAALITKPLIYDESYLKNLSVEHSIPIVELKALINKQIILGNILY